MILRYLHTHIMQDLQDRKMVVLMGPRQSGKTTLAKYIGEHEYDTSIYLNWDNAIHRKEIMHPSIPTSPSLYIFDEIHKYRKWKQHIKGLYDTYHTLHHFIMTGSSHMNTYRIGGDSMMGRYFTYTLHPFSLAELVNGARKHTFVPFKDLTFQSNKNHREAHDQLLRYGGFPEPYIKQSPTQWRRWSNERFERFVKEDIRDMEHIQELSNLELLVDMIPERVGSLLSINNMSQDIEISHKTTARYLDVLESFYYLFRLYPYTSTKFQSLKQMAKPYLWDWSAVSDEGARFENYIASHLLKFRDYLNDVEGYKAGLSYIRNKEGREVDFVLTVDKKPWFAVEVKRADTAPSSNIRYYQERLHIPFVFQVVHTPDVDVYREGIRIISADKFLGGLV